MSRHPLKIVIAGAGIGGLAAAACLKAAGFEVELYERARELRAVGSALSLMPNALTALERVGVRPDLTRAQAFDSLRFLTRRGRPIRAIDFGGLARQLGQPSLAIHRASLQQALLEQARDCRIELGVSATGYLRHADGEGVTVLCSDGREVHADVLIGADGFNSAIRATMTGPERPTDWHYVIWRATPGVPPSEGDAGLRRPLLGPWAALRSRRHRRRQRLLVGHPATCRPNRRRTGAAARRASSASTPAGPTKCRRSSRRPRRPTSAACRPRTDRSWSAGATAR
ncbi:FAD-dependent monooxygenase [Pseudomonas aeruginosa]|nr:FAD-dependent monooxygenase [Pseudomonas aeruginosa]